MFEELSLSVLDIAMNSLTAGADTIQIGVVESVRHDWLIIRIRDNGCGMDRRTLRRVMSQGFTTKTGRRKPIGLGIAFLRQTSEMCGGTFHIRSVPGKGTTITSSMRLSHVDRPPLGDLGSTILAMCVANPNVDVRLNYHTDKEHLKFSSQEPDDERNHDEPRSTQEAEGKGATAGCVA